MSGYIGYFNLKGRDALLLRNAVTGEYFLRIKGEGLVDYAEGYTDACIAHADLELKIQDDDAFLYIKTAEAPGHNVVDYSVNTITGGESPDE